MSMPNDYEYALVFRQRQQELLARAAEERLARQLPRRPSPRWRLLRRLRSAPPLNAGASAPTIPATTQPCSPV